MKYILTSGAPMPIFQRSLDLKKLITKKSFFLFGPRSTGKTTLMEDQFPEAKFYDLLDDDLFNRLVRHPRIIEEENPGLKKIIIIDEIQKLPKLLDEVHRLIKRYNGRFLLSGSSARKLRGGGANLLGGRAWEAHLFPLSYKEIPNFNLQQYLNHGGLPHIYASPDHTEELKSYVNLYLKEEIIQEGIVRKYEYFLRFLDTIALCNGEELNYERVANDAGVPPRTVLNYVQILLDTLLVYELRPFRYTKKRKAVSKSKLYLFDLGVTNYLAKRGEILFKSKNFGHAFEHFIINEVRTYLSYQRKDEEICYWRTTNHLEVDCIVGKKLAIEIKSSALVHESQLQGLIALQEEGMIENYCVVSLDESKRMIRDGISIYPWKEFLELLWSGELL